MKTDYKSLVWKGWAPANCKFFIWTLLLDSILTADKLLLRQWENDYFCPLSRRNLETAHHLFTEYPFTRQVWPQFAIVFNEHLLNPLHWEGHDSTIGT
jgi:hypothetical protein